MSVVLLVLSLLAQSSSVPQPIDAFRANHAAIQADIEFEFVTGMLGSSVIADGHPWGGRTISFAEKPDSQIVGTWSCFDEVEYLVSGSPDSVIEKSRNADPQNEGPYATLK